MIYIVMSMVASVPIVLTAIRIHGEEKSGRLEQILAKSAGRVKLYGSFIVIAVIESIIMEFLLSIGLWAASGGELSLGPLLKTGFSYLPAIWVMAGLAVLLVGSLPKLTAVVWAVFGYTFIVMYFGRIMDVPEWAVRITPFGNIPQLPVQEFTIVPLIALTLIAVVFTALGVWRFKERDVG
jgi:ABC-2 type transport system permease protein